MPKLRPHVIESGNDTSQTNFSCIYLPRSLDSIIYTSSQDDDNNDDDDDDEKVIGMSSFT